MPASAFAGINPQAVDPYPIEGQLAAQVSDPLKASIAMPLLMAYQAERRTQGANAYNDLQQQHDFHKQQLQATIEKNQMDALKDAFQHNYADVAQSGGYLPPGLDPQLLAQRALLGRQGMVADTLKAVNAAGKDAVDSGNPLTPQTFPMLTGIPQGTDTPLSLKNALVHASAANGPKPPTVAMELHDPGSGATGNISGKDPAAVLDLRDNMMKELARRYGPPSTDTGLPPAPSTSSAPRAPGTSSTQTPAPVKAVPQDAINRAQDFVNRMATTGGANAEIANAIKRAANGGQYHTAIINGKVAVSDGKNWYAVP